MYELRIFFFQEVVATLSPRIQGYHERKRSLRLENDSLRTILEIRAAESKIAEGEYLISIPFVREVTTHFSVLICTWMMVAFDFK